MVRSGRSGRAGFARQRLVPVDRHAGHAVAEELALANHRRGFDERHGFGHEMRGGDGPVQPVPEDTDGSGCDLALDQSAGPQPLRR